MPWKFLLALALPIAVASLLYGGGLAFLSSLSLATASRGAHGSGTVAATTVQAPATPDRNPGASVVAIGTLTLAPSGSQPGASPVPEDSSPEASEQRVLQSRKALETVDPKELVRQGGLSK